MIRFNRLIYCIPQDCQLIVYTAFRRIILLALEFRRDISERGKYQLAKKFFNLQNSFCPSGIN